MIGRGDGGRGSGKGLGAVLAGAVLLISLAGCSWSQDGRQDQAYSSALPSAQEMASASPSAEVLLDGSEEAERCAGSRANLHAAMAPRAEGGYRVAVAYAGWANAPGSLCGERARPCGAEGSARSESGGTVEVDPEDHARAADGDGVYYDPVEEIQGAPSDQRYGGPMQGVGTIYQNFYFRENGRHSVELTQVGTQPRGIIVTAYDAEGEREARAHFSAPHRLLRPGAGYELELAPGRRFEALRLRVDPDGDGEYEESWAPEASVDGPATKESEPPATRARIEPGSEASGGDPVLVLDATDLPQGPGAAGVGVTHLYYLGSSPWVLDSMPRIYTGPTPVEPGSVIVFWSADRGGTTEWRDVIDVP